MSNKIYSTGLFDLDTILGGGLHSHSLLTLGGRPSMGKTALMISIASHLTSIKVPFAYFSFGENAEIIARKLTSNTARVSYKKCEFPLCDENQIKTGLDGDEFQRIIYALNLIQQESSIICDDQCSIRGLIKSLELVIKKGISIIFIDYFQILIGIESGEIYQECSKMVNELKIFANLNNVTIILASQLSRKVEERPGHRPMMSDLRDTGCIEEASDQILLLVRRDYYDPMDKPGYAEIIVAKNRFGSIGSVNVSFCKDTGRFENYTPHAYQSKMEEYEIDPAFSQFGHSFHI